MFSRLTTKKMRLNVIRRPKILFSPLSPVSSQISTQATIARTSSLPKIRSFKARPINDNGFKTFYLSPSGKRFTNMREAANSLTKTIPRSPSLALTRKRRKKKSARPKTNLYRSFLRRSTRRKISNKMFPLKDWVK